MGCHLHSGGRWSGDYRVIDAATCAEHPDWEYCHVHRVKNIVISEGRRGFPARNGILRRHNPEAHGLLSFQTARPLGERI
eukprot:8416970-Pyramimonas_sp.AAC.1